MSVAFLAAAGLGLAACGGTSSAQAYGGLPDWLPTSTEAVHRVVEASAGHPQLGVEGDTMSVVLPNGRALATVVGPYDTTQGQYPPPETTPCTFILTLDQVSGTVPIEPADFTLVDELGHLYHPTVTLDGAPLPTTAPGGRVLTVKASHVMPTGSGMIRWAPGGGEPIASWDFSIEVD
jgi:hypothetical protein